MIFKFRHLWWFYKKFSVAR